MVLVWSLEAEAYVVTSDLYLKDLRQEVRMMGAEIVLLEDDVQAGTEERQGYVEVEHRVWGAALVSTGFGESEVENEVLVSLGDFA